MNKLRSLIVAGSLLATTVATGVAMAGPASADSGDGWICINYKLTSRSWTADCTVDSGYQARAEIFCTNGNGGEADFYGSWVGTGTWLFGLSCPSGFLMGGGDTLSRRV